MSVKTKVYIIIGIAILFLLGFKMYEDKKITETGFIRVHAINEAIIRYEFESGKKIQNLNELTIPYKTPNGTLCGPWIKAEMLINPFTEKPYTLDTQKRELK